MSFSFSSQIKGKEISFWRLKIFEFWHFGRNKGYLFSDFKIILGYILSFQRYFMVFMI